MEPQWSSLPREIHEIVPGPLGIIGMHHISRTTQRVEESLDFYVRVLGFQQLRRPPFSFRGAWLFGFGVQVHLIEVAVSAGEIPAIDSRRDHIAFRVADLETVVSRFKELGIDYLERVNAGGIRQIFVRDPDGHQFEFAVVPEPRIGYQGE